MTVASLSPITLDWIEAATGSPVAGAAPVSGATTSQMLDLALQSGRRLMLRRYLPGYLASEPAVPRRELDALRVLTGTGITTPEPVAADPEGRTTGSPQLLMTRLSGRSGPHDHSWAEAAGETLGAIHGVSPEALEAHYRVYCHSEADLRPPPWAENPSLWARAIEVTLGVEASGDRLIHRDFHHGNLVWDGSRIAVVDWASACVGPPGVDLAHFRVNLHLAGKGDLEAPFLTAYRSMTGADPDPVWDIVDAIDSLPWESGQAVIDGWRGLPGAAAHGARRSLEAFIGRALSDLGA